MKYPSVCPICGGALVYPTGPEKAPILILGEFPGWMEMQSHTVWVGQAGTVLKAELHRVGIDYKACRATNLWMHLPSPEPKEIDWHRRQANAEMRGRKAILLVGSDVAKTYLGKSVSDVNGLSFKLKNFGNVPAVASINPAQLLNDDGTMGEVRLAMDRFGELVRRLT